MCQLGYILLMAFLYDIWLFLTSKTPEHETQPSHVSQESLRSAKIFNDNSFNCFLAGTYAAVQCKYLAFVGNFWLFLALKPNLAICIMDSW